jgi:hypothetical protein
MKYSLIIILLSFTLTVFCQRNIVRNFSFEEGTSYNSCRIDDLSNWFNAGDGDDGAYGDYPKWINISDAHCQHNYNCGRYVDGFVRAGESGGNPSSDLVSDRYLFIKQYARYYDLSKQKYKFSFHNSVGTELIENLIPNKRYVMRMKLIPFSKFKMIDNNKIVLSGDNHLRIFFTEKGRTWKSNKKNQKWEPTVTNIFVHQNENQNCQWYQIERRFTVPSSMTKLKHLIFYVERGAFGIDEVEIFEECPSYMAIDDKVFESQYRYPYLDGYPYINQATGYIYSSNTTVKNGARVIFSAGSEVVLNNDVNIESGADVLIEVASCYTHAPSSIIASETPSVNYELSKVFYDDGDENEADEFSADDEEDVDFDDNPSEQAKTTPVFNQNTRKNKFSFHPNPTNNYLEISADQPDKVFTIIIMDSMGRPVKTQEGVVGSILVDLTSLAPGLYLAKVNDGQKIFVEKVVLSKN